MSKAINILGKKHPRVTGNLRHFRLRERLGNLILD